MRELTVPCEYDLCNCTVIASIDAEETYCSEGCREEDAGGIESEACACGHPPCDEP